MCTFHGCHGRAVTASTRLGSGAWWWARRTPSAFGRHTQTGALRLKTSLEEEGASLEDGAIVNIEGEGA